MGRPALGEVGKNPCKLCKRETTDLHGRSLQLGTLALPTRTRHRGRYENSLQARSGRTMEPSPGQGNHGQGWLGAHRRWLPASGPAHDLQQSAGMSLRCHGLPPDFRRMLLQSLHPRASATFARRAARQVLGLLCCYIGAYVCGRDL